jgi:hypothetical protein
MKMFEHKHVLVETTKVKEALAEGENEGYELVAAASGVSGLGDRAVHMFFKRPTAEYIATMSGASTTAIESVNISVASNQDPNRIAKKTAEILTDLTKTPDVKKLAYKQKKELGKLAKGDKVELTGWFSEPVVVTVDEVNKDGMGFHATDEHGAGYGVPFGTDYLTMKKVAS